MKHEPPHQEQNNEDDIDMDHQEQVNQDTKPMHQEDTLVSNEEEVLLCGDHVVFGRGQKDKECV